MLFKTGGSTAASSLTLDALLGYGEEQVKRLSMREAISAFNLLDVKDPPSGGPKDELLKRLWNEVVQKKKTQKKRKWGEWRWFTN